MQESCTGLNRCVFQDAMKSAVNGVALAAAHQVAMRHLADAKTRGQLFERDFQFPRQLARQPRVERLFVLPENYRAFADDRKNLSLLDKIEQVVPLIIREDTRHERRRTHH